MSEGEPPGADAAEAAKDAIIEDTTTADETTGDTATGGGTGTRSQRPTSEAFRRFVAGGWAAPPTSPPDRLPAAGPAARRRAELSGRFPGDRLVVPAGTFAVRSNDTDHRFRPHTAFAYLTGLGTDREPDSVLVLEPGQDPGSGHDAVLYFRPRAPRDSEEFYADARYGELWVGARPSLAEVTAETGITAVHLDRLAEDLAKGIGHLTVRVVRDADAAVTGVVDAARRDAGVVIDPPPAPEGEEEDEARHAREALGAATGDHGLAAAVSTMRLVKDDWEIAQMRLAVAATAVGFDDVVTALERAVGRDRGERVVESAFAARSRELGNGLGYDVIAASGAHACTLHWIRNDGRVEPGDLVLVDAGVEVDTLYTGDVTRTLPVSGRFSPEQRRVYQAVLDAADAAFAVVRPGASLADVHAAAMRVLAERLAAWGLLPVDVETSLDREQGGHHRRWCVHGTSHHLGMDVHDCALARREEYVEGELAPGMVFTIEPGLYFRADDELVPVELRGIGVRIEDDVLVTADGCENLSAMLPREPDAVEEWVRTHRR
ncbi:MAG: aminopeptidase P family protein [Kineosporiaceae bacterium]